MKLAGQWIFNHHPNAYYASMNRSGKWHVYTPVIDKTRGIYSTILNHIEIELAPVKNWENSTIINRSIKH